VCFGFYSNPDGIIYYFFWIYPIGRLCHSNKNTHGRVVGQMPLAV